MADTHIPHQPVKETIVFREVHMPLFASGASAKFATAVTKWKVYHARRSHVYCSRFRPSVEVIANSLPEAVVA